MNKFTRIKKTLAVSVCSSMLFSGAPKTSGMNVGETTKIVAAYFTEKTFGKISNFIKGKNLASKTDNAVIELKKAYNKTCFILTYHRNNQNVAQQQNSISYLVIAKDLIEHAENKRITGFGWLNPFDYRSPNDYPKDVEDREKKIIKNLAKALSGIPGVYNNDLQLTNLINNAINDKCSINDMELIFEKISKLELNLMNNLGLNNILSNPLIDPDEVFV
jgi:hypothetical protein